MVDYISKDDCTRISKPTWFYNVYLPSTHQMVESLSPLPKTPKTPQTWAGPMMQWKTWWQILRNLNPIFTLHGIKSTKGKSNHTNSTAQTRWWTRGRGARVRGSEKAMPLGRALTVNHLGEAILDLTTIPGLQLTLRCQRTSWSMHRIVKK